MQTFLPFADFKQSARVLDKQRLGKQRIEAIQLYEAISGIKLGWRNHPAAKMWRESPNALILYGYEICIQWRDYGYRDSILDKLIQELNLSGYKTFGELRDNVKYPSWLGNEEFHRSHRSNLIRKYPQYYRDKLKWTESDNLPYIWPV